MQHGLTNRQVAALKGISRDAVKYHLSHVLGKLQLPDRKALRQWFRVPKDSALNIHTKRSDMSTPLSGVLGQIALSVRDILVSERWYREVLGLPHLYTFGTLAFFDCGGTRLMLAQKESMGTESVLYFRVEDIEQACGELRARGVDFVSAPHLIHCHRDGTEEWMAFFKDPDGQLLALMAQIKR